MAGDVWGIPGLVKRWKEEDRAGATSGPLPSWVIVSQDVAWVNLVVARARRIVQRDGDKGTLGSR